MANEHRTRDAAIWGGALGAGAGAVLAGLPGAIAGLVLVAPATALAKPGALWGRILHSTLLMALFGALLGLVLDPLPVAIIVGAVVGALGVRVLKFALGIAVGVAVGLLVDDPALAGALIALVYRTLAAYAYRKRPLIRIMAEAVPAEELRYVVPFEARTKYVGADYVEQLAELKGGTFVRNPPDVGILASLDALDGPDFDAAVVHPLIREFYEHTSRFKLSIVPEWRTWMKPRLRAVQARRRRAARPGRDPVEHRGGAARDDLARSTRSRSRASRSTSAAGSARSPTRATRSTSASTRPSATRAAATSASASRSRARTSPPRSSRATSTATGCC